WLFYRKGGTGLQPRCPVETRMSQALVNEPVFEFTGGNLCLDFTNTLSGRRAQPRERLTSYEDLVAWGRQAGVLTDADALLLERIAAEEETLDRMLWPVIRSAADLLVSGEAQRVRRCASETCDWLFLDTSRNHSRRWCDMSGCGNRAKARRHYARAKAGRL